ncbi:MAG: DUF4335 domain-containing protein [Cyanobacteria bacterium P01_C01_bin.118]
MTIQRQYILPNCSLVLEGLSADTSNVLSILANAEFKIVGLEKPLAGGSDFFKALVQAVSAYCQRLLSGLEHPNHMMDAKALVAVEPDEGQYHRLMIKPELLENVSAEKSEVPQAIRLSTVQLFDMAEAIDQFYADTQTLPDLSVELAPLPRKYVRSSEPLAQRAIPPLLGFGTLAVAALGLFFLPVPELADPETLEQQPTAVEEPLEGTGDSELAAQSETEEPTPTVEETEPPIQNTAITDSEQLVALQQQVQQQISNSLPEGTTFEQPLRYQISVAENGDIVGYNPLDGAALENVDNTPLPSLTYIPVDNAAVGPIAQFDLTLTADGAVEVVSNQVVTPETAESEAIATDPTTPASDPDPETITPEPIEPSSSPDSSSADDSAGTADSPLSATGASGKLDTFVATPIKDIDRISELNQELRRTLVSNRETDWSGSTITYRVRLDNDGNITGYEPDNAAAEQYATDLKLPGLVKTAPSDKPQLDFLVVINQDNVIEVSPWDGWPLE